MLAVDISVYSGPIAPEHVDCWRRSGITKAIVGLQNEAVAHEQMAVITRAGLALEAYWYFRLDQSPIEQALRGWSRCQGYPVRRLWLDFEDHPGSMQPGAVADWMVVAAQVAGSQGPVGVYTAAWWWVPYAGDTDRLNHLPLWVANYDYAPDIDPVAFGGWERPSMEQFSDTTQFCGVSVDLDTYTEDGMTPEEEARLKLLEDTRWVDQRALIIMAAYRAAGVTAIKDAVAELWYVANAPAFAAAGGSP